MVHDELADHPLPQGDFITSMSPFSITFNRFIEKQDSLNIYICLNAIDFYCKCRRRQRDRLTDTSHHTNPSLSASQQFITSFKSQRKSLKHIA